MKLQKATSPLSSGNSYWFREVEKSASQTIKTAFAVFSDSPMSKHGIFRFCL